MNIDVVIVTYNRLPKLLKTIEAYNRQTVPFRSIIIVDNCSTDGTVDYLKEWEKEDNANYKKYVIYSNKNTGGSGGFYLGQKYALSLNPDWIYLSDDDAYPAENLIEEFYKNSSVINKEQISAICTSVHNIDDSIQLEHRAKYRIIHNRFVKEVFSISEYNNSLFEIDLLSYAGVFINKIALDTVGLCNPNLFIYYDDTEHSLRLKKFGKIYCIPSLKIYHDSGAGNIQQDKTVLVSWRDYYDTRNYINMLKKYFIIAAIKVSLYYLKHVISLFMKRGKDRITAKLYLKAIICAWCNILGKDKKYKPGFIIYK